MAERSHLDSVYVTPLGPTVVAVTWLSRFFRAGASGGGGGFVGKGGGGGAAFSTVRRTAVPQRVHLPFFPMCSSPNFSRCPQLGHSIRCMGRPGALSWGEGIVPVP